MSEEEVRIRVNYLTKMITQWESHFNDNTNITFICKSNNFEKNKRKEIKKWEKEIEKFQDDYPEYFI